jgi:hypothetical protein
MDFSGMMIDAVILLRLKGGMLVNEGLVSAIIGRIIPLTGAALRFLFALDR